MKGLRLLNNGEWSKPPVLTAARRIFVHGLRQRYPLCALGESASFINGTSYDVNQVNELGKSPIIRISNITDPSSAYIRTHENLGSKFWVHKGDLLVSWSASFKSALWTGVEGYLNQHIFKVYENNRFNRSYIRHAIEASFEEMQENVVGIGMMHLRRSDFLGYKIPAPPIALQATVASYLDWIENGRKGNEPSLPPELEDQRLMVARIEELAAQIDEASSLRKEAAEEAAALLRADLRRRAEKIKVDGELGSILSAPPRNGWSARCDNVDGGTPVLSLGAVTGFKYRGTQFKRTSLHASKEGNFWLRPGDVLISRSNTPELVGHAAIYDGNPTPCIYPDLMMKLEFKADVVAPRFVWYWLQSPPVRQFIGQSAKGTSPTMKKISQGTVMAIPFPVSIPLTEQRRIVAELDALQVEVDALKRMQSETSAELDALLPSVLDKAFKGAL